MPRAALSRATNTGEVERMSEVLEAEVKLAPWMKMTW